MHCILGRFQIDVELWKEKIKSDEAKHREAGLHFKQVWKNMDHEQEIFFLFEVDDVNKARSFLQKAGAMDREKQVKGEIPELIFLELA